MILNNDASLDSPPTKTSNYEQPGVALSEAQTAEIRGWASGNNLNPDIQVQDAQKKLSSGEYASYDALKSAALAKTPGYLAKPAPQPQTPAPSQVVQQAASLDQPPAAAQQSKVSTGTVTPDQTALHQINKATGAGSEFIQQAELSGVRWAASRNLINSSIAAGAARAAAIREAKDIAINDANTYSRQALANQDAENQKYRQDSQLSQSERESVRSAETQKQLEAGRMAQSERESVRSTETQKQLEAARIAQSERESMRSAETQRLVELARNELQTNLQIMSDAGRERVEALRIKADLDVSQTNARTTAYSNMISSIAGIESNHELTAQQKSEAINRTVGYFERYLDYHDTVMGTAA